MGAIIRFSCGVLGEVFQVLFLGGEPGECGLEISVVDAEEGIDSSQVKRGNIDLGGHPLVWERA